MIRNLARHLAAAGLALFACSGVHAQSTLASQPLSVGTNVPPNVMFALSVEFPTAITPAYNWASSATTTSGPYLATVTYLGYFDSGKCYDYNTSYTSGPDATGAVASTAFNTFTLHAAARYFVPVSLTTTNTCSNHWAGNFLNWVSMSGLDEFRFAMTGGNRIIDTTSNTVLQRSWQTNQGGNFGEKQLTGSSLITGATPLSGSPSGGIWYFASKNQGVQMAFDTASGGTSNSVYVQVQVCNNTVGLEANCKQYGASTYKPVGAIQNNATTMKFGVSSYFLSDSIDNAVLRAKAKFTGQYDYSTGTAVANTAQEWDPATGIFVSNPNGSDATASGVTQSGVVNYINLFGYFTGSTGNALAYKKYDNVGKLYYETLSYLRHRSPDTAFNSGANSANSDNFPFITTWDDPINNYCQKNFIFLMGDTHTHCDKRLPGGSFASYGPAECHNSPVDDQGSLTPTTDTVNVSTWTNNISSGLATTAVANSGSGGSYYMAGLAFWAHTNDIRPDLTKPSGTQTNVTTYIIDVQESQDQGVNTQFWYAAKYGGFNTASNTITTPTNSPLSNWATYDTNYDGSHTSIVGSTTGGPASNDGNSAAGHGIRPTNYLPAGNPASMISAVNSAFSAVANSLGETAAVAQSSGNLQFSGGAYLYQGTFTSGIWTGDLSAYAVSVVTAGTTTLPTPSWQASTKLNAGTPAPTARVVLTYNDGVSTYTTNARETATLSRQGIGFSTLADLSTAQQLALNTSSGTGTSDGLATNRISYIKGARTDETPSGQKFRARSSILGDIVNSTPSFIGAPNNASFQTGYLAFAQANASRTPVVYVGANDGMLHGFDALSTDAANVGKELLGYIPSPAVRNLSVLTTAPYNHKYYADGSPVVTDACPVAGGCTGQASWKSVLVSGMNAGGQGMFALDVTNPTNFAMPAAGAASSIVMWEFTDNADADLGYTFGMPLIAQMNNGNWAAIFGNGYNNTANDGQISTTGAGYLYIVFLAGPTGTSHVWTLGTDYIKLKAGNTTTTPGTTTVPNGLGGPVGIDSDLSGSIDYLYAGDLYGNIWKFDVTSATPASWNTAFSGQPLFTAKNLAGTAQPVTAGLAVSFSQYGGFFLTFGTGSFIFTNDGATVTTQTLYGILDVNDGSTRIPSNFRTVGTTDGLQQQQLVISGGAVVVNGIQVAIQSNCLVNYPGLNLTTTANTTSSSTTCPAAITNSGSSGAVAPVQLGWFFDLPNSGERFTANNALVQAGTVDFVTLIPQPGISCTGGASGFEYILNLNTGGATSGTVFDLQGSGLQNAAQMYTSGTGTSYVVSGRALASGSIINTPGRFILPPSNTSTGAAGSTGGAGGASAGCSGGTFVAGFGCSGVPVNPSIRASNGYGSGNSTGLFLPGQKGRLYWRQLFTQ